MSLFSFFYLFCFRMVEMIEKYKEEEPDEEFAELDVMERIETKFIVRKTKQKISQKEKYHFLGKLVLCSGERVGESEYFLPREEG